MDNNRFVVVTPKNIDSVYLYSFETLKEAKEYVSGLTSLEEVQIISQKTKKKWTFVKTKTRRENEGNVQLPSVEPRHAPTTVKPVES